MEYINGIKEVANPLLVVAPIILMTLGGYAIGNLTSRVRKVDSTLLRDLTSGNLVLNFLFISGFIIFGVLTSFARSYFFSFTIILIPLSGLAVYFLLRSSFSAIRKISTTSSLAPFLPILLGIALFVILLVFHAVIIYYHSIFEEYDAIYNYLLSSKSILLGNGLHHDYYRGTDIPIRSPPIENALNAWIIDLFGYSSLRLFPIYFVFFTSLYVFRFAVRVTNDSFLGWIASIVFLITPSTLIISSRFSLFNDPSFGLFLIAAFYFLVEIISQKRIAKTSLLMLMVSLALMPLSREFGLLLSFAIFFIVLSAKFSKGIKLRILFSVLSLLPLYGITFYDIHNYGITFRLLIRLATLFLVNVGLFYVLSRLRDEDKSKLRLQHFIFFLPLLAPLIFVSVNMIDIHGPYPIMILTQGEQTYINSFRHVFGIGNPVLLVTPSAVSSNQSFLSAQNASGEVPSNQSLLSAQNVSGTVSSNQPSPSVQDLLNQFLFQLQETILIMPRVDVLFTASALGTLFIFFKLRGVVTMIRGVKFNPNYSGIIIGFLLLFLIWSYFDLGFESAGIRHIAYFAPIFAVIIVLGMRKSGIYYRLFYYGIIAFATYYFLFNDIQILNYENRFGSFWIDNYTSNTITLFSLELAAVLFLSLIVIELKEQKLLRFFNKITPAWFSKYKYFIPVVIVFFILLDFAAFTLLSTNITVLPLQQIDQTPQPGWEVNVFDVVDYLRHGEDGNVLSVRAPAIPFFTNRTDFDLFDPHTFATMVPILETENSTLFKQEISKMNIRYFVFPNEGSRLSYITESIKENYNAMNIIEHDSDFLKLDMKSYTVYKFGGSQGIDLIGSNQSWTPFAYAQLSRDNGTLAIFARTNDMAKSYNRAALDTEFVSKSPLLLSLTFSSESSSGIPTFYVDIINRGTGQLVWDYVLDNTGGSVITQTFQLPDQSINTPIEIRLYAISNGPGNHTLFIKRAHVLPT
jgi:hypothetical protein